MRNVKDEHERSAPADQRDNGLRRGECFGAPLHPQAISRGDTLFQTISALPQSRSPGERRPAGDRSPAASEGTNIARKESMSIGESSPASAKRPPAGRAGSQLAGRLSFVLSDGRTHVRSTGDDIGRTDTRGTGDDNSRTDIRISGVRSRTPTGCATRQVSTRESSRGRRSRHRSDTGDSYIGSTGDGDIGLCSQIGRGGTRTHGVPCIAGCQRRRADLPCQHATHQDHLRRTCPCHLRVE